VTIALDKIRPLIQPGETVVSVLTGHGLKHPPSV
jgi:threonine synthase